METDKDFSSMIDNLGHDMYIWQKSPDKSFTEINSKSRVPERWMRHDFVYKDIKYEDSIIKPLNPYVLNLYPAPKLISINNNTVTLQQQNHAEIFLLLEDSGLYHTDRPWIRQYYLSDKPYNLPQDCFDGIFRFYMPWFINENLVAFIEQPEEESPFFIYTTKVEFAKHTKLERFIEPAFIDFHFKKHGSHMVDDYFGKIARMSPMFNIVFEASDIMIERVRKFYEEH